MNDPQCTPELVASQVSSGNAVTGLRVRFARAGPVLRVPALHTERDERSRATCAGGLILPLALWRRFGVAKRIDADVHVLARHRQYRESDHVLAQVLNMYAGGTCIEDQTYLQQDQSVLRMLGTEAFPHPTTSGHFLRRFEPSSDSCGLKGLRGVVDKVQGDVWSAIPARRRARLGGWGFVDMDSHIAAFYARQKEGADFAHTGQWGLHPLLLSLANTSEILAIRNRPGNVTSADGVEALLDEHLPRLAQLYGKVLVRGDSGFDRAAIRAAARRHGAHFATVGAARPDRMALALAVPEDAWQPWVPPSRRRAEERRARSSFRPRRKGDDLRCLKARQRRYASKQKTDQWVTEVEAKPTAREEPGRLVIVRSLIRHENPQQMTLFDCYEYRFVITDLPASFTASDVVDQTYQRCDQENMIAQLGDGVAMWHMPAHKFAANEAWLELARLAWNLVKWVALLALPLETLRWELKRFRRAFVTVAAEVVLRARQTWVRFNPSHRYTTTLLAAHSRLGP